MPPKIALLICSSFILGILIMDSKRKSDVSRALWIPLIWMLIVGSRMVSYWLNLGAPMRSPDLYLTGSPFDRMVFLSLIIAGVVILSRRKINWLKILRSNAWLVLLSLYGGISILWSDFPFVSFKRWIKASGNLIMVLIVLTDADPVEAIKRMFRRCAYVLIPLSIILIKYFPHLGRAYHRYTGQLLITGVTTNKNTLGSLCLVCGVFFFWNIVSVWRNKNISFEKKEVLVQILIFIMILWLLIKSNSATSIVCFIIGICTIIVINMSIFRKNAKYIGKYIVLISLCFLPFLLLGFDFLLSSAVDSTGHSETFWGRVSFWPELIGMMEASPVIGIGYDSFWLGDRMERLWAKYWWHPTEAHNGYVETFLELGLIGLVLLAGVIICAYRNICREFMVDFDYGRFRISFLIIALFFNVTESAFNGVQLLWFIFLLIAVECPPISQLRNSRINRLPYRS